MPPAVRETLSNRGKDRFDLDAGARAENLDLSMPALCLFLSKICFTNLIGSANLNIGAKIGTTSPVLAVVQVIDSVRLLLEQVFCTPRAERNDIRAALRQGLADLSPTQKRALELFAVGKSYAEISRETGVTLQAVRQTVERATGQMRPFLASRGVCCAKFLPECRPENGVKPVSLNDLYPEMSPQKSNSGCTIILMVFALLWGLVWLIQ